MSFQGHQHPTSEAILREAGDQIGVKLALANGRVGSTWKHGSRDAPYAYGSVVVRLPDGRISNIDSTMPPGAARQRNTRMIKEHFARWLTGEIDGGRAPRQSFPDLDVRMRALLTRAGILPDRAAVLCTILHSLDGHTADGCKITLRYSETYGHSGSLEILPGVTWNGKCLTVRGTLLPETLVRGIKGAEMRSIVDHEAFEDMKVGSIVTRDKGFSIWPEKSDPTLSQSSQRSSRRLYRLQTHVCIRHIRS